MKYASTTSSSSSTSQSRIDSITCRVPNSSFMISSLLAALTWFLTGVCDGFSNFKDVNFSKGWNFFHWTN